MKKMICTILSILLIVNAGPMTALAYEKDSASSVLSNIVNDYLTSEANAIYLCANNNLIDSTVTALPKKDVETIQETLFEKQKSKIAFQSEPITINADIGNYLSDKATYQNYIRESQGFKISDFNIDYGNWEEEVVGSYARVKVSQTVSMIYDGLTERSATSTNYIVDMVKTDRGWLISNIQSDDLFDKIFQEKGIDLQAEKENFDKNIKRDEIISVQEESQKDLKSYVPYYLYNNQNAAFYSNQFVSSKGGAGSEYYNNACFTDCSPGDCQNYASQAVWAGFGGSCTLADVNSKRRPIDTDENGYKTAWYPYNDPWAGTLSCQTYVDNANSAKESGDNWTASTYQVQLGADLSKAISNYKTRLVGAIVYMHDKVDDYGHAAVVARVDGPSCSQVYINAHTNNHKLQPLSSITDNKVKFVIPEKFYCYGGFDRIRLTSKWHDNYKAGTTAQLQTSAAFTGGACYRMSMKVETPSGSTIWLGEQKNTSTYTVSYTFKEKCTNPEKYYKITTYARGKSTDADNTVVSQTIVVRTW